MFHDMYGTWCTTVRYMVHYHGMSGDSLTIRLIATVAS